MAGAACKRILNGTYLAVAKAMEEVLIAERGKRLKPEEADALIQRMADIDIAAYHGTAIPAGGLAGVMGELVRRGIFTDEIYALLQRPGGYEGAG